jgi:hypothetical protein
MSFKLRKMDTERWEIVHFLVDDDQIPNLSDLIALDDETGKKAWACECPSMIIVSEVGEVSFDEKWETNVMSAPLQLNRILKNLVDQINSELDKPTPDLAMVEKLQRECKKWGKLSTDKADSLESCIEIFQRSLDMLALANAPKPIIEAKLQAKIVALEAVKE